MIFPEVLDLTPFATSGQLSTQPSAPISSSHSSTPPSSLKVLYRLSSIVCHYGGHTFGHYVAYRRKPGSPTSGANRFAPPTIDEHNAGANAGWLRISDDTVQEVGLEAVLAENSGTFMLFYERIATSSLSTDPRSTAMDLPTHLTHPTLSLRESSTREAIPLDGSDSSQGTARYSTPRIVRSVSAGVVSRERSIVHEGSQEVSSLPPAHILSSSPIPEARIPVLGSHPPPRQQTALALAHAPSHHIPPPSP